MCNVSELKAAKQRIKELESQLAPPLPPTIRREIGYTELHGLLLEKCPQVYLSDSNRSLCDIEDINSFLSQDETNRITYQSEVFDCDDFTYRLMGQFSTLGWANIAKGIVWTNTHALMCCVDSNLDFWYIEPQNDTVKSKLEAWQGSTLRFIML